MLHARADEEAGADAGVEGGLVDPPGVVEEQLVLGGEEEEGREPGEVGEDGGQLRVTDVRSAGVVAGPELEVAPG